MYVFIHVYMCVQKNFSVLQEDNFYIIKFSTNFTVASRQVNANENAI